MAEIYESKSSFRACVNGRDVTVRRGDTVRGGHPLHANHPDQFRLLVPRFEHTPPKKEAPSRPPAPQVPKPPAAAKATAKPAEAGAKAGGEEG